VTEVASRVGGARFIMRAPDDFHVHFRQGSPLGPWALRTAGVFKRALVMPNVVPPASTPERVAEYRNEILAALAAEAPAFEPLMAFKLLPGIESATVRALADSGCVAGKYYPAGSTTNADDGVPSPDSIKSALGAMQELGLILSIHAEDPAAPVLERETAFLPVVGRIAKEYPRLKIVVEHLSRADSVEWILNAREGVAATVTAHHLMFTIDDMLGGHMDPFLFCKPIVKERKDRDALRGAVLSGDPRFFFGSDSAPHARAKKESGSAPAGAFTAPVALPLLAGLFLEAGKERSLEAFCSENGADFYGIKRNEGRIAIVEREWIVPEDISGSRPLLAGTKLRFDAISA